MKLSELFASDGTGVIATASAKGEVNVAMYAAPHIIDDETVAWGMTDSTTFNNIWENPRAAFLYRQSGKGYAGCRMTLELREVEDSGRLIDVIRSSTRSAAGEQAAAWVSHVAYFRVVEVRPLL